MSYHDASDECPVCGCYWEDGEICDYCYAEKDAREEAHEDEYDDLPWEDEA